MIRPWTKSELARAIELRLQGHKWADIAARINRSESAMWVKLSKLEIKIRADGRDETAVRENLVKLHHELLAASAEEAESSTPDEAPDGDPAPAKTMAHTSIEEDLENTHAQMLLEEAKRSTRKYEQLIVRRAMEDRIVDVFKERLEAFVPSVKTPDIVHLIPKKGRKPESAVLLISDTHVGQVVSPSQAHQGNYNPRVYCERLHYLQQKVVEVLGEAANGIDELHVLLLGDIVHGGLNHGAEREDNLLIADQFQLAVWTLHQFLCSLAFRVPRIQVHTVVGNHGRWPGQHKMPTKNRFSNLDQLVYICLQLSLQTQGLTNITVHLNDSPRQVIDIKGSRFLAAHGDHLRGGDRQFGVPIHSMTRDVNATAQRFAASDDRPVDYFLCGDKHRSMSLPLARGEFIINGSMVGNDEFSMTFCPGEPMQLLFGVDSTLRKTWAYPIKVMHAPALSTCPYHLPERIRAMIEDVDDRSLAA